MEKAHRTIKEAELQLIRAWMSWYLTAVYGKVRQIPMVYLVAASEAQLIKRYAVLLL